MSRSGDSPRNRPMPFQHGIEPLRTLEADVPVPFVVEAENVGAVAVHLNVGQVVLIDAEGFVSNESGTGLAL